jgi:flagellar assembly protein FliH
MDMDTMQPFGGQSAAGVLFAEDFDFEHTLLATEAPPEPELIAPHYTADDLEVARNVAWAEGAQAGLAEASAGHAAAVARALTTIATTLRESAQEAHSTIDQAAQGMARLLLESLAAMLPESCAAHGEAEVRAVVRAILPGLRQEPSIAIRIHPRLAQAVEQELSRLDPDLSGRVSLIPTDAMMLGDVRITWENGSACRDVAATWRSVSDVLCSAGLLSPAAGMMEYAHGG